MRRLPEYWELWCAGHPCPQWANAFLSSFDWTFLRLQAFLASVLQPGAEPEPDIVNATPTKMDLAEQILEVQEEMFSPLEVEVEPA